MPVHMRLAAMSSGRGKRTQVESALFSTACWLVHVLSNQARGSHVLTGGCALCTTQAVRKNEEVDDLKHMPKRDLKAHQWGTCALVGQAAGLRAAGVGTAVDAHEAVWRFNLQAPTANTSRWVGQRTTVRMMNHPASHLAYDVALNELGEDQWGDAHQVRHIYCLD